MRRLIFAAAAIAAFAVGSLVLQRRAGWRLSLVALVLLTIDLATFVGWAQARLHATPRQSAASATTSETHR